MKLKLISVLLALVLCIGCLAGCGSKAPEIPAETAAPADDAQPTAAPEDSAADNPADDQNDESSEAAAAEEARQKKYQAAYEKYAPDTVVMTVNGQDIVWSDFFCWLYDAMSQLESSFGVTDWSAEFPQIAGYSDDPSYGGYALSYASSNAMQISVINSKAVELGAVLDEAQEAELDDTLQTYYGYFGGEEAFREQIAAAFLTEDYFREQNRAMMQYTNLYELYYGKDGADFPEEDAVSYLKDHGYLYAKHILFMTVDAERNPLSAEEISAKRATAEEVLAKLKSCPADQLEETFDKLMSEYSEDTGLASYPNGYYFVSGEMVPEFEAAAAALGDNEFSDLVESTYGYHILFCPPMEADDVVGYNSGYEPFTARSMASSALFGNVVSEWFSTAEIVPNEIFESFDLNALFVS